MTTLPYLAHGISSLYYYNVVNILTLSLYIWLGTKFYDKDEIKVEAQI